MFLGNSAMRKSEIKYPYTIHSDQINCLRLLVDEVENAEQSRRNDICAFLKEVIVPRLSKEKQAEIKTLTDKGVAIDGACEMCGVKISCIR